MTMATTVLPTEWRWRCRCCRWRVCDGVAMAMPMLPMARWRGDDGVAMTLLPMAIAIAIAMAMSMAIAIPLLPISRWRWRWQSPCSRRQCNGDDSAANGVESLVIARRWR